MAPSAIEAPTSISTDLLIPSLRKTLCNESVPLSSRYRALFALKHHACALPPSANSIPAIHAIAAALSSPSALLKHELAYCLGQTGNVAAAAPYLRNVLMDFNEDPMCRHEAAEALGALGDTGSLEMLRTRRDDGAEKVVVRETCEIAVERLEWEMSGRAQEGEALKKSDFVSIDPAPPLLTTSAPSIPALQTTLLNTSLPLFTRYRAMFALRDLASPPTIPTAVPAVHALASGFVDPSALFRHEIAFVFGQLSHPASVPSLMKVLGDKEEASMVRHEAAEALGDLGAEEGVEKFLRGFVQDEDDVVRDSVIVALDMAEYEQSGELHWAGQGKEGIEHSPLVALKA